MIPRRSSSRSSTTPASNPPSSSTSTAFGSADKDLETSPIFAHCKRKKVSNDGEKEKVRCEDVVVLKEDDGVKKGNEEENWLPPPPPKPPGSGLDLEKDETLQELRLKKQELASLARSAQDVLKDLVENAERELKSSRVPAEEVILDSPEKPQAERQKIVISIQGKDEQKQFRVYSDDKFEKLFKLYAKKTELKPEDLTFCFDGDKVSPTTTPTELGLEDGDMIEVHVKPH
ncbi:NFATC2-interacting protein isoform X1 [Ananas comosus]|uniref:NFATC2-interacting protein isoform X1 n=1 Tax=Ananas comosus TaxID=4615 RepID=A0A6P5GBW5_ANACO|nr:NFATC2-interacting protein isoform X1 [Ananas comosus]XP_020105302.1 NFATC2-interacting protein isoform X1 [Ananas comosus]